MKDEAKLTDKAIEAVSALSDALNQKGEHIEGLESEKSDLKQQIANLQNQIKESVEEMGRLRAQHEGELEDVRSELNAEKQKAEDLEQQALRNKQRADKADLNLDEAITMLFELLKSLQKLRDGDVDDESSITISNEASDDKPVQPIEAMSADEDMIPYLPAASEEADADFPLLDDTHSDSIPEGSFDEERAESEESDESDDSEAGFDTENTSRPVGVLARAIREQESVQPVQEENESGSRTLIGNVLRKLSPERQSSSRLRQEPQPQTFGARVNNYRVEA